MGKGSTCNAGDAGDVNLIPGLGRSPKGGHGNPLHNILAWRIPWTEEPGELQSQRVGMTEAGVCMHTHIYMWRECIHKQIR